MLGKAIVSVSLAVAMALSTAVTYGEHAVWPANWNDWSDPALWVTVGNPGNTGELSGYGAGGVEGPDRICGAVGYTYNIGKYEVTAGQYTEFLNAVARTSDRHGLYNVSMWSDPWGCKIQRTLTSDIYTYTVAADRANRPVNWVSWGDAARFANWLYNGQPTGVQNLSTTEDGAYFLNGALTDAALMAVTRKTGATRWIPTEDEWYKAAYHKNDGVTGNYYDYPTCSDTIPTNDLTDPDGGNSANFWEDGDANVSPYGTTEVGEFENSESPYGTFDQGGNIWSGTRGNYTLVCREGCLAAFGMTLRFICTPAIAPASTPRTSTVPSGSAWQVLSPSPAASPCSLLERLPSWP